MERPVKQGALQRPKGTQDILAPDVERWQFVENQARQLFASAGYSEIRTPIFEATHLFERGVGESTDIVNKEMYTFEKGDRFLTLRPENTAGVVRAYIENGLSRWPKPVKLFYMGPMFRYERPQAGRQRQFNQLGIEMFGLETPSADAEAIAMAFSLLTRLNLPQLTLEINNIGCLDCRETFKQNLKALLKPFLPELCESCQVRYEINPLRMLDCKVESCQRIYARPEIAEFLQSDFTCEACQTHFASLLTLLKRLEIPYQQNHRLVRGLDYYSRTVFEITSTHLGSQNAVCGGGRYNHLVSELGGPDTPAVGWAIGLERLISLLPTLPQATLPYYIVSNQPAEALSLATEMRLKGNRVEVDLSEKALGKQLGQADKKKAERVIILGDDEIQSDLVTVKNLQTGEQSQVSRADFLAQLN